MAKKKDNPAKEELDPGNFTDNKEFNSAKETVNK